MTFLAVVSSQLPPSDVIFQCPKLFHIGCHPHGWCHPGRSPPSPSDASGINAYIGLHFTLLMSEGFRSAIPKVHYSEIPMFRTYAILTLYRNPNPNSNPRGRSEWRTFGIVSRYRQKQRLVTNHHARRLATYAPKYFQIPVWLVLQFQFQRSVCV